MLRKSIFGLAVVALLGLVSTATAGMYITEWMYNGSEFVEFTNIGSVPVDMAGWSFDDDSRSPGTVPLSAFGIVQPGKSVLLTEVDAGSFAAEWNLSGVAIIGGNSANLGRNDEINLYNAGNVLVDRLTFGDQNIPGSIRTQNISGNPITAAALGANDVLQWTLAVAGDAYGSHTSVSGFVGNPGINFVPEPSALALLGVLVAPWLRRR